MGGVCKKAFASEYFKNSCLAKQYTDNQPLTKAPRNLFFACTPQSLVFPLYFLPSELSTVPDTAGPRIWILSLFYYFITRTQDGTKDKGYSKIVIDYISIGLFANLFLFSI